MTTTELEIQLADNLRARQVSPEEAHMIGLDAVRKAQAMQDQAKYYQALAAAAIDVAQEANYPSA